MKVIKNILTSIILTVILTGCSTMFNGSPQTILAHSSDGEDGIKVEVRSPAGSYLTKLPATISAESDNEGVKIRVVDKCYDPTETTVGKNVTASYWANLLNGWGFLIDWATGKMWKYDNNVYVPLNKKEKCENKAN